MSLPIVDAARGILDPVLAVVFPSPCPVCGQLLPRLATGPLCEPCWRALPRHHGAVCGCGLPLAAAQSRCGRCRRGRQPFVAGASLGPYDGSLRIVLRELKYRGRRRAARRLAVLMLEDAGVRRLVETSDVLVPVPLHPRRLRARGFNQSLLLAEALGELARTPCCEALVRRLDTPTQTGMCASERRRNVRDAFGVRRRAAVSGRAVTLVDDVLTTGATVLACARALAGGGAGELRLLTVARA